MSDIKEEMLSVDWPLESRDDGAGGGGPRGLWIPPVNIDQKYCWLQTSTLNSEKCDIMC